MARHVHSQLARRAGREHAGRERAALRRRRRGLRPRRRRGGARDLVGRRVSNPAGWLPPVYPGLFAEAAEHDPGSKVSKDLEENPPRSRALGREVPQNCSKMPIFAIGLTRESRPSGREDRGETKWCDGSGCRRGRGSATARQLKLLSGLRREPVHKSILNASAGPI